MLTSNQLLVYNRPPLSNDLCLPAFIPSLRWLYVLSEPTEDWTVEQVLQWWLLRAHSETDAEYEKMVDEIQPKNVFGIPQRPK